MIYTVLVAIGWIVAFGLTALIWLLAGLHVYWGRGGLWPASDETGLARTVVGAEGIHRMPGASACYAVGAALFAVGLWPLMMVGAFPVLFPAELAALAAYLITIAFLARGVAAFLPIFRQYFPEEPFATLDRERYGPLCLMIGTDLRFSLVWDGFHHELITSRTFARRHRWSGRHRQDDADGRALPQDGGRGRYVRHHQ